jgi:hypothetical protein
MTKIIPLFLKDFIIHNFNVLEQLLLYLANNHFTEHIFFISSKIFLIQNKKYRANILNIEYLNFTVKKG